MSLGFKSLRILSFGSARFIGFAQFLNIQGHWV